MIELTSNGLCRSSFSDSQGERIFQRKFLGATHAPVEPRTMSVLRSYWPQLARAVLNDALIHHDADTEPRPVSIGRF